MRKPLLPLLLFGVSFGYVEAAVVTYLRAIYDPLRAQNYHDMPADELFPLITLEQLRAAGPEHIHRLGTELAREAATLIALAAVALAAAKNFRQWLAGFMFSFGVWDISYYTFLKVLINWPQSLLTWDILFLIPVPWVGPVVAPVIVSVSMIVAGVMILWREKAGNPIPLRWPHGTLIVAGGVTIIVAFCWDYRNIMAGGQPNPFNWALFAVGEFAGCAAFWHATSRGQHAKCWTPADQIGSAA